VEAIYYLNPGKLETDHTNLIYLCRPKLVLMKYIAGTKQRRNGERGVAPPHDKSVSKRVARGSVRERAGHGGYCRYQAKAKGERER
jgi:hypothetical protein